MIRSIRVDHTDFFKWILKLILHIIVTDTHQHVDRGLYTYMTSYLAQAYRLSILIDKPTLFINSWLIRLSVDNVLLINTRSLSIVINKPIPRTIGISIRHTVEVSFAEAEAMGRL